MNSIEEQLGRKHRHDKYAPRTIDIDIVLFDDEALDENSWYLPFVVVPLADIYPNYRILNGNKTVLDIATRIQQDVWLEMRRGVLG